MEAKIEAQFRKGLVEGLAKAAYRTGEMYQGEMKRGQPDGYGLCKNLHAYAFPFELLFPFFRPVVVLICPLAMSSPSA